MEDELSQIPCCLRPPVCLGFWFGVPVFFLREGFEVYKKTDHIGAKTLVQRLAESRSESLLGVGFVGILAMPPFDEVQRLFFATWTSELLDLHPKPLNP